MNKYRFHWRDGKTNEGLGSSPEDAFSRLGFGAGAVAALDYYETVDIPKSCRTCRWYNTKDYWLKPVEECEDDDLGACEWPAERLPESLRYGARERVLMEPAEGTDCPCWEPVKNGG